jgi:GTP-binding protein EngB required for normal cell division
MKTKYVTVKVSYDTEETWDITLQEIKELFQMMNNLKRNAIIIDIEQGINQDDEEIHRGFTSKL